MAAENSRGDNWKIEKRRSRIVWMNDRDGNFVLKEFNDIKATSFNVPERYEGRRVTRIGARAFANCGRLRKITLPETLRVIEKEAFWGCKSLRSITFGGKELQIGAGAFAECESLAKIALPETLQVVEEKAFLRCESLRSATFGSQLREIGAGAFGYCASLMSVTFPDGLQTLGEDAFSDCGAELTLYAQAGSVAEEYARENGLRFEAVDAETATDDAGDGE